MIRCPKCDALFKYRETIPEHDCQPAAPVTGPAVFTRRVGLGPMKRHENTKRAGELKVGEAYRRRGRGKGETHKAIKILKSGPWLLVSYAYLVTDNDPIERSLGLKWYSQRIPPIERIHTNTLLTIGEPTP